MSATEFFEILIIGSGKAGKTLAADLARMGRDVALVERNMIGGTCINVGCIPSKALIRSAQVAELVSRAEQFGIHTSSSKTDMPAVRAHKRAVVAGMVELNWSNLHGALGDKFILGDAIFVAPRTVEVRPADGAALRRLTGQKLFINLGARAALPAVPGLLEANPLTSESALELDRLPAHLVVMGGGYIGVELGQAFRRFGSRVTILQHGPHLLPMEDADASSGVEALLREDGIDLLLHSDVLAVTGRSSKHVELRIKVAGHERTLEGSDLLVAVGRAPMTDEVGLEAAGVELDAQGFVRVNDRLETTAPLTWAMGDCAGSPQQTHVALDDYRIVKANVFGGGGRSTNDRIIPHTVFIDPELGRVGLTEREARRLGLPIKVAKVPASVVPRARTLAETTGFLKAIIHAHSGQILGFSMLGAGAGEVTAVVQTAMIGKLPYTTVRDAVIAHPTMAEGLNYLFGSTMRDSRTDESAASR